MVSNQSNSIIYNASYGPTFGGGHDIYISDKCNLNSSSYANICHCFKNSNYAYGQADTYKRFTGGSNYHFRTL